MAWWPVNCVSYPAKARQPVYALQGVVGERGVVWGLADERYGRVLAHKQ